MESNKLYSLSPNEDVTILNIRSKPLVLDNTYINHHKEMPDFREQLCDIFPA